MIQFDWSEQIQNWAYKTWRETKGDEVKIAILDTGVDLAHPSLRQLDQPNHKINAALPGFSPDRLSDFWNSDVTDRHRQKGHGTQCVSVLSATEEGENTLKGIAPKSEIFIIKVNTVDHKFFLVKDFLKGLEAAARLKVDIIISSICFPVEDVQDENIAPAEIQRVFTAVQQSGAVLFTSLPNMTPVASWSGLAKANYPNHWNEAVNVGALTETIYNNRKTEINTQPDIHFLASNANGTFCKINNGYVEEAISSSYGVYITAAVAALYISSIKKREKEAYQPRPRAEFLEGMSKLFKALKENNSWDGSQPVLYRTSAVSA
jgi:subtilisin family serine protease